MAVLAPVTRAADPQLGPAAHTEVIVELAAPPAARAWVSAHRRGAERRAALARVDAAQRAFESLLRRSVPNATVRWRYRIVLNGLAIVAPRAELARLAELPGVIAVYPSVRYHGLLDRSPGAIGAPALWGSDLENAGHGIKIGIIDDGIDQSHPFFDPAGFSMPAGFPKGERAFTSAKVIVARSFPPAGARWRFAARPFDPVYSFHGTHVAGIAAGNHGTVPRMGEEQLELSGVAPLAYLANYKALTYPTDSGLGLNGNSPELVAAIEAAVADGMDVINLSLGEPQIEPERDAVARALDNAALAGVVPVVAAGNDYQELGLGSVGSPGTSQRAITVGAVTREGAIASFSSSGPTPLDSTLKPDVSAPGVDILSAAPQESFERLSGTSMASPHVAGAAALLRELHPDWSVEEIKSSLVLTAAPVRSSGSNPAESPSTRQGGGLVDLPAAASPWLFASPQTLGFGLLDVRGGTVSVERQIALADGGDGEIWSVSVDAQGSSSGTSIDVPASVEVPGVLTVAASADGAAAEGEHTGFLVLERDGIERRLPYWFRVTRPKLPGKPAEALTGTGAYTGNTRGRTALVDTYRYPEPRARIARPLAGPEQVFRLVLGRPVANFGVAVISMGRGVAVEPRIVSGADENRLAGVLALPFVANPYLTTFLRRVRSSAVLLPSAGSYSIVFDTTRAALAGPFSFRLWIDDVKPPTVKLLSHVAREGTISARVRDAGSGIDPRGITYTLDGGLSRQGRIDRQGLLVLDVSHLRRGTHRLVLRVSDRQEAKNNENVAGILPNTRVVETTIRIP